MFKSYLKIALRNLWRHKGYSFINIGGLAVGMACALFILLWVQDELSFDRFHVNAKNLYRVEMDQAGGQGTFHVYVTPYPMGPGLKAEIPEIKDSTRVARPGTLLVPFDFVKTLGLYYDSWNSNNILAFVRLQEKSSVLVVSQKITRLVWDRTLQGLRTDAVGQHGCRFPAARLYEKQEARL